MSWNEFFALQEKEPYFRRLSEFLVQEYESQLIFPPRELIFNAFKLTAYDKVKVVIIGQDPYQKIGQAMGLAFSAPCGVKLPPSLQNIYREISNDLGVEMSQSGDLTYLANQGVLLLNAFLTVRSGEPLSHNRPEYLTFLEKVLQFLNNRPTPIVFLLWGNFARKFKPYINNSQHLILEACHPSPLSANQGGFFGCKHFSKTNAFLMEKGMTPINWKN